MRLSDSEDHRLQFLWIDGCIPGFQPRLQILQRSPLARVRRPVHPVRLHEIVEIPHSIASRRIQVGMRLGRRVGRISPDKAPQGFLIRCTRNAREIQKHRKRHDQRRFRHVPGMDVEHRVRRLAGVILLWIGAQLLVILVHGLRNHIEEQPLRGLRLLIHEIGQALGRGIGQPLVDRDSVARRFRDLLALIIQEQLIAEMLWRPRPQRPADRVIDRLVGRVFLAIHFEIDAKRRPTGSEIRLPLQLHVSAGDRQRPFAPVFVIERDLALRGINVLHRHIKHAAGFRVDRKENRIGLSPLVAQRFQHDRHQVVIPFRTPQQDLVEPTGFVEGPRRIELVFKTERVQETAQHRVVVVAKALMGPERVGHRRQRLLDVLGQHLPVRHIPRNLPHPVQIVRKADQLGRNVADHFKGAPDHRRSQHLAEGTDMRQPAGTIAGLEQHEPLFGRRLLIPFQQPTRLFERPGLRTHRSVSHRRHRFGPIVADSFPKKPQGPLTIAGRVWRQ